MLSMKAATLLHRQAGDEEQDGEHVRAGIVQLPAAAQGRIVPPGVARAAL